MAEIGVSFSLHRCSELGLNPKEVLTAAITDLGFKRFRLMSYWNIHEQQRGNYNFAELDWQLDMIAAAGGTITLCVGKRQPRWPECHMPAWAQKLPKAEWYRSLYDYIQVVVERYKDHPALESWQLENEALLKDFGYCVDNDYSHERLRTEYQMIKSLDPSHHVVMTLSDSWGIPWRRPRPDVYAMSLYRNTINKHGRYTTSKRGTVFYRLRRYLIWLYTGRHTFIHELQGEPWLDKAILEVGIDQQLERMSDGQLRANIDFAYKTNVQVVDLWGLEWWYWLTTQGSTELWNSARDAVTYFTDSVKE